MNRILTFLIMLIIWGPPSIRFTPRSLDATLQNPGNIDLTMLMQIMVWLISGIIVIFLLSRQTLLKKPLLPSMLNQNPSKWYFIYGIIAVISTIYSVFPLYTLYFSAKIVVAVLLIGYWIMLSKHSFLTIQKLLKIFYMVFILQGSVIILLYFLKPEFVGGFAGKLGYRLTGGIFSDYGISMLLSGLFFLNQIFNGKKKFRVFYFIAYLVTWYFLLLSKTRSSIAVGVLFLSFYIISDQSINKKFKWVWSLSIIALIIFWMGYLDPIFNYLTRKQIGFTTLSGRTIAFTYLVERWKDSPLLGYGFAAGARIHLFNFVKSTGLGMGDAHDSLSKVLIDLGVVGLVPILLALISAWRGLIILYKKRKRFSRLEAGYVLQLICLMIMVMIQSVFSNALAALSVPFIIIVYSVTLFKKKGYINGDRVSSQNFDRYSLLQSGKIY